MQRQFCFLPLSLHACEFILRRAPAWRQPTANQDSRSSRMEALPAANRTGGEPNGVHQALWASFLSPYTRSFSPNIQICYYGEMYFANFNSGSKMASWHDIPKLNWFNNIRFHRFACYSKVVFLLCILVSDIVQAENTGHKLTG